jgi:hypothetical protein
MSEEIIGILPAKQATIFFTSDNLIFQKKGLLSQLGNSPFYFYTHGFFTGEAKDLQDAQRRVKDFGQSSLNDILSDKRSTVLPYSDVWSVEFSRAGGMGGDERLTFRVKSEGKERKHKFEFMSHYKALAWKFISIYFGHKVIFQRPQIEHELRNCECYVLAEDYCEYLRKLGMEASITFISPISHVTALIKLSNQNIDYIFRAPDFPFIYAVSPAWYVVENISGRLDKTKTKRKGKGDQLNFQWVGDEYLSSALNQDIKLMGNILQLMKEQVIRDIYIEDFKNETRPIYSKQEGQKIFEGKYLLFYSIPGTDFPRPSMPSCDYLNVMNNIAGHIKKLLKNQASKE